MCVGLYFTVPAAAQTHLCPELDLDGDCYVDLHDLALLAAQYLCGPIDCNEGYNDCDGIYENGCEVYAVSDVNNCGACGHVCSFPRAVVDCNDGNCIITGCYPTTYANCDGQMANGCETDLLTNVNHCGQCGHPCILPHANAACTGGQCIIASCANGYANCDGNTASGCEINLNSNPACSGYTDIGWVYADEGCTNGPSLDARGEKWYGIQALDGSSDLFNLKLYLTVGLTSPPGIDYDLYLYDSCGSGPIASSTSGSYDEVSVEWDDNWGSDDSRDFIIEVRYFSGASCSNWDLQTWGDCQP